MQTGFDNLVSRRVFSDSSLAALPKVPETEKTTDGQKTPIGVATMDSRGIVVLELRLTDSRLSRQAQPVHYWPGMPDYLNVVRHIGINPGQTKFVYPFT